jgi:TRAP-type C4-dicarboxylate transport system substrate-binding protein
MQVAMANKKWWDGLPAEAQKIIMESAKEAVEYQRTVLYPKNEADARKGFEKTGITIHDATEDEIAAFRKLTQPVFDEFAAKLPAELVKLVQDTQK